MKIYTQPGQISQNQGLLAQVQNINPNGTGVQVSPAVAQALATASQNANGAQFAPTTQSNSQPKTVFQSVFNLGEKLLTTGKAKFSDYAGAAFDVAKNFLKDSSWLENSTSVLANATRSAFEADSWKGGLKNAGKVIFDWGKNLVSSWF